MEHEVSLQHLEWFEARGISEQTLKLTGIYSGRHQKAGDSFEVVADINGKILVYPYYHDEVVVNAKYRAAGKIFYQMPGGTKTFWNVDILDDSTVQDGTNPLVITEGENDALATIEAGYPYVVSVPDGAPPHIVGKVPNEEIDPEHDVKYGYIFNNWEALKGIRKIIIATDGDEPGRRLAEELVRRLGRVRCLFISYPVGCKDLNEVLTTHGAEEVNRLLRDARPYPVSGIFTFSELPPEPELCPLTTGWGRLDDYLKPFFPAFMVVTGIAGSGKSTWVNQLAAQMSITHGIPIALASFEMRIKPFISDSLLSVYKDMRTDGRGGDWLENNFIFIAPEPDNDSEQYDVDWLIEKATTAVIRHGIRILVADPWNEIEHAHRKYESQTEYISRSIKAFKRFARQFEVFVILVAHPSKSGAERAKVKSTRRTSQGGYEEIITNEITLYDISDSAHFSNKADFGVVIHRIEGSNETNVMIKKVRYQKLTGKLGMVPLTFDETTRTFSQ